VATVLVEALMPLSDCQYRYGKAARHAIISGSKAPDTANLPQLGYHQANPFQHNKKPPRALLWRFFGLHALREKRLSPDEL
jgi:hypothetical protein